MNLEQVQTEVKISLVQGEVKSWSKFREWRRWTCFLMFAFVATVLCLWVGSRFDLGPQWETFKNILAYLALAASFFFLRSVMIYTDALRKESMELVSEEEAGIREYELSLARFADEKAVHEYFCAVRAITDDIVRAKRLDDGYGARYLKRAKDKLPRLEALAKEICQGNGSTYLFGFSVFHNRKLRRYESYLGVKPS